MEGEMLKGHLDMIVLAALSAAGSAHGYAIIEEIKRRSGGAFDLPEGTIYPALHRLEQAGLLSSRWMTADSGRRRRVYTLTRTGNRALVERRAVWKQFSEAIGGLLGGHARTRHDSRLSRTSCARA
jgi:transcriptional regulator